MAAGLVRGVVTRLVTGLITDRGVCAASVDGLAGLFPEQAGR